MHEHSLINGFTRQAQARAFRLLVALLVGTLAFAMVLGATEPVGPGLDPDAMSYLGAARSFVAQRQFMVPWSRWSASEPVSPLRHFPPGFPLAIAMPTAAGLDAIQAARLVNATAAFVATSSIVLLVGAAAGLTSGVVAALLALVSSPIADMHLNVLSEPLFLACITLTLAALTRRRPPLHGVASGLAAAAAVMLRYAGIAMGAAASLWMLLDQESELRPLRRLRNAIATGLPTAIVMGAWVLHNRPHKGEENIRSVGVYGHWAPTWNMAGVTVRSWLAPSIESPALQAGLAVVVLVAGLLIAVFGRRELIRVGRGATTAVPNESAARSALPDESPSVTDGPQMSHRLLRAIGLLAGAYAIVLLLSRAFADPGIPFDERILSPLVLLAELAFAVMLGWWWRGRRLLGRISTVALMVLWAGASLGQTMDHADYSMDEGSDMQNASWRESDLIDWVRTEGRDRTLFTNWPSALYFHAGRASHELPNTLDPTTLRLFNRRLARTNGVIIAFNVAAHGMQPDSIVRILGLHQVEQFDDGAVWEAPRADCTARAGGARTANCDSSVNSSDSTAHSR